MTDQRQPDAPPGASPREDYTQRDNPAFDAAMTARTATHEAAFFLPHLRPGLRLLDVGCGPGTITLGLAAAVAPGEVVALDLRPEVVAQARAAAAERGVANARFEVGSAYALPFPDASFDAACAHIVLMHLREPVRALAEIPPRPAVGRCGRRARPGRGGHFVFPLTPLWERYFALSDRVRRHNGGDTHLGRAHRRLLLDAGFARAEAGASLTSAGTLAETRQSAAYQGALLRGIARTALAEGWADQATLDAMLAEFAAWAERPDAFLAAVYCHAVGWAGE